MFNPRYRFIVWAVAFIVGIWLVAMAGHWFLENLKMTADKVRAYVELVDFSKLTGEARAKALKDLEDKLNGLSYEERQRLRGEQLMKDSPDLGCANSAARTWPRHGYATCPSPPSPARRIASRSAGRRSAGGGQSSGGIRSRRARHA